MAFPAVTICLDLKMDQYFSDEACLKNNVCSDLDEKLVKRFEVVTALI